MDRKNLPVRQRCSTFHAMTYVWNRDDLDLLFNVCLPNQRAPGNSPALPEGSRYRILTPPVHRDEIDGHPSVRALRAFIPVDVVTIDDTHKRFDAPESYELMSACHRRALRDAFDASAALLLLPVNGVCSDRAISAAVRRHREGYRAVVNIRLRINREPFLRHLSDGRVGMDALSSRELVATALPHLHADSRAMFADARPFSAFPVAVYWRAGDDGLVARALHLHPLLVDPVHPIVPGGPVDGRYLRDAVRVHSIVHVVNDSDELQMFELTDSNRKAPSPRGRGASIWRSAIVAQECTDLERAFWRTHPITVHARGTEGPPWVEAQNQSASYVARVAQLAGHPRAIAAIAKWPRIYWRISKRRDQYLTQARRLLRQVARHVEKGRKEVSRASRMAQKRLRKSKLGRLSKPQRP
jgi:hypothetical protein